MQKLKHLRYGVLLHVHNVKGRTLGAALPVCMALCIKLQHCRYKKRKGKKLTTEPLTVFPAPEVDNTTANHKFRASTYRISPCHSRNDFFHTFIRRFYNFQMHLFTSLCNSAKHSLCFLSSITSTEFLLRSLFCRVTVVIAYTARHIFSHFIYINVSLHAIIENKTKFFYILYFLKIILQNKRNIKGGVYC